MAQKVLKTRQIVNNIKQILLLNGDKKRIFDCDVADVLHIPCNTLTQCIKRDSPPYKEMLEWCQNTGVGTEFVFFGMKEVMLDE